MNTDYQKQANDFLKKANATFKAKFIKNDVYFTDDKQTRDIYRITLTRNGQKWTFRFGQSIADSDQNTPPTTYDVLASITKYKPESFEYWCYEFGYDTDSRKALKTYKAIVKEWESVNNMFNDVLDELQEIN